MNQWHPGFDMCRCHLSGLKASLVFSAILISIFYDSCKGELKLFCFSGCNKVDIVILVVLNLDTKFLICILKISNSFLRYF